MTSELDDDTVARSYRYLRLALVALLISMAASVFYQSRRQGSFLASVSAYYYTPAQGIFVGALVGVGACMIALRGTTSVEAVALNVGGAFATLVATIPTSRGPDFRTAVEACRAGGGPLLTRKASSGPDCPTVQALAEATGANVQNNVVALLFTGLLAALAALFLLRRDRRFTASGGLPTSTVAGFVVIGVLWVGAMVGCVWYLSWLVDNGHYLAGLGLLLSVLLVAVVNARRHQAGQPAVAARTGVVPHLVGALRSPRNYRYSWIAGALLVVAVIAVVMRLAGVITLFWLEIVVAGLFVAFWTVQTFELDQRTVPAEPGR
jgi:hypothetical protein